MNMASWRKGNGDRYGPRHILEYVLQEILQFFMLRMLEDLFRTSFFHDQSIGHEYDSIGHFLGKTHFMSDAEHGHALFCEALHDCEHLTYEFRVQGAGRFIEKHDLRFHGECSGDSDTLLLAARKLARIYIDLIRQADSLDKPGCRFYRLCPRFFADQDRSKDQVLKDSLVREEIEPLEHHPHFKKERLLFVSRNPVDGMVVFSVKEEFILYEYPSARDLLKVIERPQVGRLSCTGRADDDDYFTFFSPQGQHP